MKKTLSFLLLVLLLITGCTSQPADLNYRQISSAEAAELMQQENDYIILDVRTQKEYAEGHIPDAICIPNETIGDAEITALPDKNQFILVYCRSGNRSKQAAQKLADLGYTNIVEFGGINSWTGDVVTE